MTTTTAKKTALSLLVAAAAVTSTMAGDVPASRAETQHRRRLPADLRFGGLCPVLERHAERSAWRPVLRGRPKSGLNNFSAMAQTYGGTGSSTAPGRCTATAARASSAPSSGRRPSPAPLLGPSVLGRRTTSAGSTSSTPPASCSASPVSSPASPSHPARAGR